MSIFKRFFTWMAKKWCDCIFFNNYTYCCLRLKGKGLTLCTKHVEPQRNLMTMSNNEYIPFKKNNNVNTINVLASLMI